MEEAITQVHMPTAVAKRITIGAVRHRNRGRSAAVERHPFNAIGETSGRLLCPEHAQLDEMDPKVWIRRRRPLSMFACE
jgi:hypothetical protein